MCTCVFCVLIHAVQDHNFYLNSTNVGLTHSILYALYDVYISHPIVLFAAQPTFASTNDDVKSCMINTKNMQCLMRLIECVCGGGGGGGVAHIKKNSPKLIIVLNISGGILVARPSIESGGEIRSISCIPLMSEQHEQ